MKVLVRYVKFNVVGALGIGVQLCALALWNRALSGHYLAASILAVECAIVHNFAWHVGYTWRNRLRTKGVPGMFWRFQLSNGAISLVGNVLLMRVFVHGLRMPLLLGNLCAIACCSLANFWLAEVWAFAESAQVAPITHGREMLLLTLLLVLCANHGYGQAKLAAERGGLGTDCAYENWFAGPAAAGGGLSVRSFTGGVTFGQYFPRTYGQGVTASPQFELGMVGPLLHGTKVDGLVSVDAMFAKKVPARRLYPSATIGYSRLFINGNAINFGVGVDFGADDTKHVFRMELRDYYLFTGPRQHVLSLRFGVGRLIAD